MSTWREKIEDFRAPAQSISARHLNQLTRSARMHFRATPPLKVTEDGDTIMISTTSRKNWFVGKISPIPGSDYSDEHYYIKRQKLTSEDSSDLTWANEDFPSSDRITVTNLPEIGASTHNLPSDMHLVVYSWKDAQAQTQYFTCAHQPSGTHDSPKGMYSTFEGDEAAQTDTWDATDQGGNDGVTMALTTRVVYNDAGDEKLYGFHRTLTFDSLGALLAISAETRYEVDAPDAC